MDGGITYRNFSPGEIASTQRCELRTCILAEPSYLTRPIAEVQSKVFSRVATTTDMLGGNSCDIGFRYRSLAGNNDCDVLSAYTNEVLFHIEAWIDDAARIACRMLGPNEALGKKLAAQRLAAGRAAPVFSVPASAAGVSSEQLAKLVSDAVKNTQPSAPPAAPSLPSPLEPSFHSRERPDDLAVIVGIETYSDIASKAPYAERDAAAVKAYIRALGVPERNIVLLTGSKAVRSALTKNIEGWLPRMTKPDSRVYFYFSGHGAPDVKTSQAYLVPWDGDPNFLEATAYPVAQLYKKL